MLTRARAHRDEDEAALLALGPGGGGLMGLFGVTPPPDAE